MKSRYLLFFLPLIVAKYTSAATVQLFHSPEESVNSQFYLPPPPGNDDPAFRYDKEAYFKGYAIKGSHNGNKLLRRCRCKRGKYSQNILASSGC